MAITVSSFNSSFYLGEIAQLPSFLFQAERFRDVAMWATRLASCLRFFLPPLNLAGKYVAESFLPVAIVNRKFVPILLILV